MKIGIIRTSSIGDVVLASACLHYLSKSLPDADIVWIGRQPSLELIRTSWPNVETIDWPSNLSSQNKRALLQKLSLCDTVIDLQTSFRSLMLGHKLKRSGVKVVAADKSRLARTKLVVEGRVRGRLFKRAINEPKTSKLQFELMLDTLKKAVGAISGTLPMVNESSRPLLKADNIPNIEAAWAAELKIGNWIAISPGASYQTKRAPSEVFLDVLRILSEIHPATKSVPGLVFIGNTEDRTSVLEILDQMEWEGPILNLAGKLSLEESMFVLSKCRTLLSNDSGLAHIAEAIDVPVNVLFGPTVEDFGFAPRDPRSRSFSTQLGCRPCSKHGKSRCRYGDKLCFRSIDAYSVADSLNRNLIESRLQ